MGTLLENWVHGSHIFFIFRFQPIVNWVASETILTHDFVLNWIGDNYTLHARQDRFQRWLFALFLCLKFYQSWIWVASGSISTHDFALNWIWDNYACQKIFQWWLSFAVNWKQWQDRRQDKMMENHGLMRLHSLCTA